MAAVLRWKDLQRLIEPALELSRFSGSQLLAAVYKCPFDEPVLLEFVMVQQKADKELLVLQNPGC